MKRNNPLLTLILLLFVAANVPVQAQKVLKGKVLNGKTSLPIPYVTVALHAADSSVLTGSISEEDGSFRLVYNSEKGSYLSFSCVGFMTFLAPLNPNREMEIRLMPDTKMLSAVNVNASAPVIEQQMDKLVMNVAQSAFAQGNNAQDLLRKAPGVSIDKDGNVQLNGQSVSVWIDGRPTQLDGKSLEAMLKAMDGSSIDKIEVIANPSAKYDAEGQGGIIDIKTRRHFRQGFNGSLDFNTGGMVFRRELEMMDPLTEGFFDQEISLNLNYRSAKTNTFLQFSESTNQLGVDVISTTDLNPVGMDFYQRSLSRYNAGFKTLSLKLGNDWFINRKNTLGVIVTLPFNEMNQWADTNVNRSYQQVANTLVQQVKSCARTDYRYSQYMGNLNYTHVFNEAKMSEMTTNLDYMHYLNISDNPMDNYYLTPSFLQTWRAEDIFNVQRTKLHSDNAVDVYSVKTDWQRLLAGMFLMEAGGKYAQTRTDNSMERSEQTDGLPAVQTRTFFDYTEHIAALYATLSGQFKSVTLKAGLRGEYTHADNTLHSVRQDYADLFPTFYVGYNTKDMMKRFGISYTRRIQRPNYMQLNPFRTYVDAHTSNMGNPDLKPSYGNNLSLTAGFGPYITLTGMYMHNTDVVGYAPQLDPVSGDQTLFADNIGENILAGGTLTLSELPLGKKLTLMLSANIFDFHCKTPVTTLLTGVPGSQETRDEHSFFVAAYGCLTLSLPGLWKLQLDGFLSSPVTQGYMHIGWNGAANFALKKTALDGRLLMSLSLDDIFRSMNSSFSVYMNGTQISLYEQTHFMQTLKFGLQWNFGKAQKPLKMRRVGDLDEASRMGGNNGLSKQ